MIYRWYLFVMALMVSATGLAKPIHLNDTSGPVPLLGHADLAIDRKGSVPIWSADQQAWQPADEVTSMSFGYSTATYWLRFEVVEDGSKDMFLVLTHPVLDDVTLQCKDRAGRVLLTDQQGDAFPFAGRKIQLSLIAFRLPDVRQYRCLVQVRSTSTILLDAVIVDANGMVGLAQKEAIKTGMLSAAILALALFMVGSNAFNKSLLLPTYAVASVSIAAWNAVNSGIGAQYLWPGWVWWQQNGAAISGTLSFACISAYVWLILRSKAELRRASYVPAVATGIWLVVCAAALAQDQFPVVVRLYGPLGVLHAVAMVAVMVYASLRQRDVGLYILTIGQVAFAVPTLMVAALMLGILPPWGWLKSLLPFSFVAELFFLALSLAYETELVRRQAHALQLKLVEEAKLAKERQEAAVNERTGEISAIVGAAVHDVVAPLHHLTSALTDLAPYVAEARRNSLYMIIETAIRIGITAANIHAFERFRDGSGADSPPNMQPVKVIDLAKKHVLAARLSMGGRVCLVDGDDDAVAICDKGEVGRIIDNMLSNFWRHTPPRVTMVIRVMASKHNVQVRFEDDGPGMMALRHQMREFASGAMRRGKVGGLYNCMRYAVRNGGALDYEDSPTGGACFVLTLLRYGGEGKHE